jgi:hypothetical protein
MPMWVSNESVIALFRRLAIKVLDVCLRVVTGVIDDAVPLIRPRSAVLCTAPAETYRS